MRVKSYFSNWLRELLMMMTFRSKLYWHFHYELCCCIIPAPLNCRSIWPLPVIINGTHSFIAISSKKGVTLVQYHVLYRLQLTVEFFLSKQTYFRTSVVKLFFTLKSNSTSQHFCCDIEGTQNAKKDLSGGQGHTFWGTGQQSRKRLQKILTVASFRVCVPLI